MAPARREGGGCVEQGWDRERRDVEIEECEEDLRHHGLERHSAYDGRCQMLLEAEEGSTYIHVTSHSIHNCGAVKYSSKRRTGHSVTGHCAFVDMEKH